MAATIKEVARRAGVSPATVSKYLNGSHLKEKNKIAVEEAIRELDFQANAFARSLRKNESKTVGVLIPELDNVFSTQIVSNLENCLMEHGYSTLICDYKTDAGLERQKWEFLKQKMADAIVVMPYKLTAQEIKKSHIPVVLIDRGIEGLDCDSVLVDNEDAAFQATEYLLQNGHREIGILCGPRDVYTALERRKGYEKALRSYGLEVRDEFVYFSGYDLGSGYEQTRRILSSPNRPTALFATNHELTTGAVMAIQEQGLHMPDDLSFIGFDNRELSEALRPKLSVVLQPIAQIGEAAAALLLERLLEHRTEGRSVVLKTELVQNQSVGRRGQKG